jgi:hypothetical protein
MSDDEIIRRRIAGHSVRAIAKAQGTSTAAVSALRQLVNPET